MKTQLRCVVFVLFLVMVILYGVLTLTIEPSGLVKAFESPLASPSRVLQPPLSPLSQPPAGPRIPAVLEILPSREPLAPLSPLASPPPPTLEPQAHLPMVAKNWPLYLFYGPKGLAGHDAFDLVEHDVWYRWSPLESYSDPKVARMIKCPTDYHLYEEMNSGDLGSDRVERVVAAADSDYEGDVRGRVWLIFNEPDSRWGECGLTHINGPGYPSEDDYVHRNPAWAAERYVVIYNLIKAHDPYARVFAGGLLLPGAEGRSWWNGFLNRLDDSDLDPTLETIEGVHIHAYPDWSAPCNENLPDYWCMDILAQALNEWYDQYHVQKGLGDRPIWITETGTSPFRPWFWANYDGWDEQVFTLGRDNVMQPLGWWFTGHPNWAALYPSVPVNPGYDSLMWFVPYCEDTPENQCQSDWWVTFLYYPSGQRTPLGNYWADGFNP
jgi:hypothetical protein